MTSRRAFVRSAAVAAAAALPLHAQNPAPFAPLGEFGYSDVELASGPAQAQFDQTISVLMSLNEDSLLKPWRLRAGLPAPGPELGGWYDELPLEKTESGGHGFAPAHSFGQWISALSRAYAAGHSPEVRTKLVRLLDLYEPAISAQFYKNFRFPAYNFDKMVIGLSDACTLAGLSQARTMLDRTTAAALPSLPPTALNRDEPQRRWRERAGESTVDNYTWDESYTLPENLYLAAARGGGDTYKKLAARFLLDDTWFTPLSEGRDVLAHHHAYSFCNSLNSAMQAYLVEGSTKHLRAASNAFDMLQASQSFATGGWGPNESFVEPDRGELYKTLTSTHRGFETPCGSYAHFKLTRSLLRVTQDGRYGDTMERVLYNTVLGAKPLEADGHAFYYSDYNQTARKTYFPDRWPCCSGTLPQVTADYRLLLYFRQPDGVLVNLYLPSTLRWTEPGGAQVSLQQSGGYPEDGRIAMRMRLSRPASFAVSLRIPAWVGAGSARLSVNGTPVPVSLTKGFARVQRKWQDEDRVLLALPMTTRLEPIDRQHPDCVAVLRGPRVLFAVGETPASQTRQQLLVAKDLVPFTAIGDRPYRTYLNLA